MDDEALACLQIIASESRQRILEWLDKGVDHPEDLAKRLKLRRQGVDKHLLELYESGFVDRSAVLSANGRPRIVYRLSERGRDLLGRMGTLVKEFYESFRADCQRSLAMLEDKLAAGELDEDAYLRQRQAIEKRYARFLPETDAK